MINSDKNLQNNTSETDVKYKQIPFNITIAKLINEGSVDGRIIFIDDCVSGTAEYSHTNNGKHVFRLTFNKDGFDDYMGSFNDFGICVSDRNMSCRLMIEIPVDASIPDDKQSPWTVDKTLETLQALIRNGVWSNRCFESICCEIMALHERKNKDYGGAFNKSMSKYGVTALMIRLNDKWERLESLFKNGKAEVADESFEDTLMDLASYAIMGVEHLHNIKK